MRKLEVGVQSGNWYREDAPVESIEFIKRCGFEGIDYNINNLFARTFNAETLTSFFDQSIEDIFAYYKPLKEAAEKNDISFSQFHGAMPMYFPGEDERNEYYIQVTEKMMAVCQYLNCKYIVIHPWSGVEIRKEEEIEINMNLYRKLIPGAKKYGVKVCLENLFKHYGQVCIEGTCCNVDEACQYVDTLNAEAGEEVFGFCLDVGHVNVVGRNIYHYIKTLGKRLSVLHIHDNDGTIDSHMIPYTQRTKLGNASTIDWDKFILGLKEIGYEGPIAFETFNGVNALPVGLKEDGLKFISAIGRYFRQQIEA